MSPWVVSKVPHVRPIRYAVLRSNETRCEALVELEGRLYVASGPRDDLAARLNDATHYRSREEAERQATRATEIGL